jgi:hypothetical protein
MSSPYRRAASALAFGRLPATRHSLPSDPWVRSIAIALFLTVAVVVYVVVPVAVPGVDVFADPMTARVK